MEEPVRGEDHHQEDHEASGVEEHEEGPSAARSQHGSEAVGPARGDRHRLPWPTAVTLLVLAVLAPLTSVILLRAAEPDAASAEQLVRTGFLDAEGHARDQLSVVPDVDGVATITVVWDDPAASLELERPTGGHQLGPGIVRAPAFAGVPVDFALTATSGRAAYTTVVTIQDLETASSPLHFVDGREALGLSDEPLGDVLLSDIDVDGHPDVLPLATHAAIPRLVMWRSGEYREPLGLPFPSARRPACVWLDADGDTHRDLACWERTDQDFGMVLYRQLADQSFAATPADVAGVTGVTTLLAGDVDGDGRQDVVVVPREGAGGGRATVLLGTSDAGLLASSRWAVPGGESNFCGALGDVDADGDLDLLLCGRDGILLVANEEGGWAPTSRRLTGFAAALAVADVDRDGWLDVVAASQGAVRLFPGSEQGLREPTTLSSVVDPRDIGVGDVDADGDLDVVVVTGGSDCGSSDAANEPDQIILLDGGETRRILTIDAEDPGCGATLSLADLDLNGNVDLVITNGLGATVGSAQILLTHGRDLS